MNKDKERIAELEIQIADLQQELEETYRSVTELTNELARKTETLEQVNKRVAELARIDELTGISNRRYLMEQLNTEIRRAQRYRSPIALCMLDLDHFKRINDSFGHDMGDTVLKTTARIINETTRDTDITGRYGGEEFVVVFTNTDLTYAQSACERMRKAIAAQTYLSPHGDLFFITCSIGLTEYRREFSGTTEILKAADKALYRAKTEGRDRVVCFKEPGKGPPEPPGDFSGGNNASKDSTTGLCSQHS